jgi:hypothetical protein
MTMKPKTIEDRVSDLEREVTVLKGAIHTPSGSRAGPGFAEEGQPPVLGGNPAKAPSAQASLEARVANLERDLARLRDAEDNRVDVAAWRATLGCFKDDPDYEKAIKSGAAWRRRAR